MRLVKGGRSLDTTIEKLAKRHNNIAFAVAWASTGTKAFNAISLARKKIKKAVIGTHFYQTHPDVLDSFTGFSKCRFVLQPHGVFHPKVFLFWSKAEWELLIGSANLTKGALTKNSELLLHVSSRDTDRDIRTQTEKIIYEYWKQGEVVTRIAAQKYRTLWATQQNALHRVSGKYSSTDKSKAPIHSQVMAMSWQKFIKDVKNEPQHGIEGRCALLEIVREAFSTHQSFSQMDTNSRKVVAGLPNDRYKNWGWFGSMRGAGYYSQAIIQNNPHISAALDYIPREGAIIADYYYAYIKEFVLAFPKGRDGVSIASRLLALKRPDYFVCLDSKNKKQLCKDFGITQSGMDYNRYWDDVTCRVMDSVWWNSPKPKQKMAAQIWAGRAAMLDALFYKP